ncbi:lysozyme [Paraburkholderia sp. RCC_158]|uniref:lysozyme n=1 Tax=Paraburkholderia sp. RCC_158 TaxID=3239220 RepID=UPI0035267E9A
MNYSKAGLALTEHFEGCYLHAYPDPASPLGKELQRLGMWRNALNTGVIASALLKLSGAPWTIGVGHTGPEVRYGLTWTQDQADAQLLADVAGAVATVNRLVKVALTQAEFDALVDFVFNVGAGNFAGSTLLKLLNAGNRAAAAHEFEKWDMAAGKHLAGLLRRRIAEEHEFLGEPV